MFKSNTNKFWVSTAVIVIAYYGTGILGQILAIPPGNITVFWPPSGIALAAMLLIGRKAGLGIFLGGFLANVSIGDIFSDPSLLFFGSVVGVGSALQPLLGVYLLERLNLTNPPFNSKVEFWRFILVVPVIAIVSCSFGTTALLITDGLQLSFLLTWMTWWGGDALGMIVFTPIVYFLFKGGMFGERGRLIYLTLVMSSVAFLVMSISIFLAYNTYIDGQRARMSELAQSQAQIIESVARFDALYSSTDVPGGARAATLSQVEEAYANIEGFGATGEYLLAQNSNDSIEFILSHRGNLDEMPQFLPLDGELAIPMSRALQGQSGNVIANDYRGVEVLAAYDFIEILDIGLVVYTEMSEIREPFVSASAIVVFITVFLVSIGVYLFQRISAPLLKILQRKSVELEELVNDQTQELQKSEQQLKEESELLDATLRGANLGLWDYDVGADRLNISDLFEAQYGFEPGGLQAEHGLGIDAWAKLVHPEEVHEVLSSFQAMLNGDALEFRAVCRVKTKAGNWKWVMAVGHSLGANEEGKATRAVGIQQDISEQKDMESSIRSEQERLRLALEGGKFGTWVTDPVTGENNIDDRWAEILGYEKKEIDEKLDAWSSLIHEDYKQEVLDAFQSYIEGSSSDYNVTYQARTKSGNYIWLQSRGAIVEKSADGEPTRVIGIVEDVTEQKETEAELIEAKALAESATEAKASFLAAMSHEIRTPMNGVVGMVDLLAQTEMDSEQQLMLQTVKDSGQSLLIIINDILDFSKIEAGKLDLESIDTQISELVETSAQTLAPNALKNSIQLITYIDPDIPQYLKLDPVRIRQILINLGSNAIKFSKFSEVIIRASCIRKENKQAIIRFEIIDQGIGISDKAQSNLFEEFSQADTSTTRKFGGTGLGLAISKRLTELMNGQIGVNSKMGEGSTFYCEFPFPYAESREEDETKAKEKDLSNLHVLLVAPSKNYQDVCSRYLSYWNAEVSVIGDIDKSLSTTQDLSDKGKMVDIIVILDLDDQSKVVQMREQFQRAGFMPYPRFVIGDDPRNRSDVLQALEEVTLVNINPLQRASFITAVAVAAGRASPEIQHTQEIIELKGGRAPTPAEALQQDKLILFAEDNLTNQDVIRRQLTKLGYACEIANDGVEAFEMWRSKSYAMLLTDCHMPEWDGFELTAAVRKDEESSGKRVPIVAITANALQGEAERCIAGGMDDYMSKPVEMETLQKKLFKWMGAGGIAADDTPVSDKATSNVAEESTASSNDKPPVDENVLKSMLGDDDEMFKEVLQSYVETTPVILDEIFLGKEKESAEAIKAAAHKLKSSSRSIGADELADLCVALETAGGAGDWATINEGVPKLSSLFEAIEEFTHSL